MWDVMLDCSAGSRAVKSRGTDYLPKTSGMLSDSVHGQAAYEAYVDRAIFPDVLTEVTSSMSGVVFSAPPKFELPGVLDDMVMFATRRGCSMETLVRQVVANQLTTGRVGLLLDPRDGRGVTPPYVCVYHDKAVLNWGVSHEGTLEFVVLNESGYVTDGTTGVYGWAERYRVCALEKTETGYGGYYTYTRPSLGSLDLSKVPEDAVFPEISGKVAPFIPFVFINSTDVSTDCSNPLMLPVAEDALAAYRNSADYELALYMTAQATTIVTGANSNDTVALGSNRVIYIKDPNAKVYFHEISGSGIDKQKQAIDDKIMAARRFGVELVENSAESGTALNTRLTIKTASLMSVVLTCEEGVRRLIRMAAEWCGYSPEEVIIELNKDFRNDHVTSDDIVKLSSEMRNGAFTRPDMYKLQLDGQWTTIDSYEEWEAETQRAADVAGATAFAPTRSMFGATGDAEDEAPTNEEDTNVR